MTVVMANGPGDVEYTHLWTPGDGSPALLMNKLDASASAILMPRIRFDKMPGFRSRARAEDNRGEHTGRQGTHTLPSLLREKDFTVEGFIDAYTLTSARTVEMAMSAAFAEVGRQGVWSAIPLGEDFAALTDFWQARMRVTQFEPDTEFVEGYGHHPALGFLLGMRMADSRWFWTAPVTASGASVTVTPLGSAPADPVITVTTTGTAVITNTTTGELLRFPSVPAGTLVIDFTDRSLTLDGAALDGAFFDAAASTWWHPGHVGLRPGAQTISVTGASAMSVTFRHASW